MADARIQGSFAFRCTRAELALIEEAFEASYERGDGAGDRSPPTRNSRRFSGRMTRTTGGADSGRSFATRCFPASASIYPLTVPAPTIPRSGWCASMA
jgi:hypothetical protein